MQALNLPPYNISVRRKDGRDQIFDILRQEVHSPYT